MAGQMFGGRGAATFLGKVTTILATLYMLIVIGLNLLPDDAQRTRSIIQEEALRNQQASSRPGIARRGIGIARRSSGPRDHALIRRPSCGGPSAGKST